MTGEPEFHIIPLDASHAQDLAQLHRRVMGEPDGWRDAGLRRLLTAEAARGFEAKVGDAPAGYILAFAAADEAEILALCVAPEHRRLGIARTLIRALTGQLAAEGIAHLHLEVRASNLAARELYRRTQFADTGRRKGYYHGINGQPPEDAVVMSATLPHRSAEAS